MHIPLINFLSENCLNLQDFYIFCKRSPELSDVLEKLYTRSRNLRIINCHAPLDTGAWTGLSSHTHLRSLTIPISSREERDSHSVVSSELITFPSLEELHLSTSFTILAHILSSSQFPILEAVTFDLESQKPLPGTSFAQLTALIARTCSHSVLRAIDVSSHQCPAEDRNPDHTILPDALRPLLVFSNLHTVVLNAHLCLNLDDVVIRDMALAWPRLTHLWLDPTGRWPIPSRVTLNGLIPLAEKCPQLRKLGIPVNANISMPFSGVAVRPGRGRVNYQLRAIMVGNSYISSSYDTAAFLSDIFPNLRRVDSWLDFTEEEGMYKSRWNEVGKLVPCFTQVRMQERNWIQCGYNLPIMFASLTLTDITSLISRAPISIFPFNVTRSGYTPTPTPRK